MAKMQPAIIDLQYTIPAAGGLDSVRTSYIDTAKGLSRVNRRLYEQGRLYGYQGLTYIFRQDTGLAEADRVATLEMSVRTAGNTWVVQNSFVKGKALWNQMQDLVLEDNPSVAGKWHDFKTRLVTQSVSDRQLDVLDGYGNPVLPGEWAISKFVMPQHSVDGAGNPLPADEKTTCLIGPSTATIESLTTAYQNSRSTVQPLDPNVPAAMSTSFFNLLTDSGSQEPELADVIEDENDAPPYDTDSYPGADINMITPMTVGFGAISQAEVDGRIGGFVAPCGLLEIEITGYKIDGTLIAAASMPAIDILLHVAPGMYKGVAAIPMGQ